MREAFHGKGYLGYKSKDAQKKFADSLLKIADKMFWAPMAYIGASLYQAKDISFYGYAYVLFFFVLGVSMRHQALKVYDSHDTQSKDQENKNRVLNKK